VTAFKFSYIKKKGARPGVSTQWLLTRQERPVQDPGSLANDSDGNSHGPLVTWLGGSWKKIVQGGIVYQNQPQEGGAYRPLHQAGESAIKKKGLVQREWEVAGPDRSQMRSRRTQGRDQACFMSQRKRKQTGDRPLRPGHSKEPNPPTIMGGTMKGP